MRTHPNDPAPRPPREVTDPQFAFAAGAESADHVKARLARHNLVFRALVVAAILCTAVGLYLVFAH